MSRCRYFEAALLVLWLPPAAAGCAARHRPPATAGDEGPPAEGRVGFDLLPDPHPTMPALSGHQVFMAPLPFDTPLPEYPKQALAEEAAPVTVVIRIVVDEAGVVGDVLDSPLDEDADGADRTAFRAAAEAAVRTWRFGPATIRTLEDGEDINHDGKPDSAVVIDQRPVRSYLDLRFTFEVVGGRGRVKIGTVPGRGR